MRRQVLFVAGPLTSRGGVYNFLTTASSELSRQGVSTTIVYSSRVGALEFPDAAVTHRVDPQHALSLIRSLRAEILRQYDPTLGTSIVSTLPQSDVACALLPRALRAHWSPMVHGSPVPAPGEQPRWRRWIWQQVVLTAYRGASQIIVVSEALRRDLMKIGVARPIEVVSNGVAHAASPPRRENRQPTIGFLGRFSIEKGPDIFLEVARRAGCPAVMFGAGPLLDDVRVKAAGTRVRVAGWGAVAEAFHEIDILVMPSRREGLGLAMLEAGAAGIPVVAPAVGGLAEIMGHDAWLAATCLYGSDPLNLSACAERLVPLLTDDALRREAGERLRAVVAEHYSLTGQIRTLLAVLASTAKEA